MAARPSFSLDPDERAGRRPDLRPARRDAPADRARRRPRPAAVARCDPDPAGAPVRAARFGGARRPGAAAHPARRDRLELRPSRRARAGDLLERLACFIGGCDLDTAEQVCGPAERARPGCLRRDRRPRRPEPDPAIGGGRRHPVHDAGDDPRLRPRATRGARRGRGAPSPPRPGLPRPRRAAAPELSGADQKRWLERLEREHDNFRVGAGLGGRHAGPADRPRTRVSRSGGSGRSAATSRRLAAGSTISPPGRGPRTTRSPTPASSRPSAGSPTGRATSPRSHPGLSGCARRSGASSATGAEIANALYNLAFTYNIDSDDERARAVARHAPTGGRCSKRRSRSSESSTISAGSATSCGRSGGTETVRRPSRGDPCRSSRRLGRRSSRSATGRWRPGRST